MSAGRKFSWYLLGQLIAYAVDIGTFLLVITVWNLNPVVCNIIGKMAATCFGFTYHATVSFRGHDSKNTARALFMFVLVVIGNIIGTSTLLWAGTTFLHTPETPTKLAADVVGIVATYLLVGKIVFPKSKNA
jgi:putative flippase GtrA